MAVRSKEEILEKIRGRFSDTPTDSDIELVEDVADTFESLMGGDNTDWKTKYEENDAEWRKRYTSRFFDGVSEPTQENENVDKPTDGPTATSITIDDLFEED